MWRSYGRSQRPIVLLLGWLGSKERYLQRYSALWQGLGAQVIVHQPSILQTAVPSMADQALLGLMKDFTVRYSNLVTVMGDTPPVMVHTMSNAGFIAFGTALHLVAQLAHAKPYALSAAAAGSTPPGLSRSSAFEFNPAAWAARGGGMTAAPAHSSRAGEADDDRLPGVHPFLLHPPSLAVLSAFRQVLGNTQGIVIDSAPSQATPNIWSRGLVSALLSEPAHGIEEAHPLMVRVAHRLAERYFLMPQVVQRIREVRHAWLYNVPPCPQLYLYSKADALIPYQHIEHWQAQQAAHSVPIHHHCWNDSAHCEHYRKHPEQYRSLVHSFLLHCLHHHTPPETWI